MTAGLNVDGLAAKELGPSCLNASSLNWNLYEPDFEFVFADGRKHKVPSFCAEMLSQRVSRVRVSDARASLYAFKEESVCGEAGFKAFGDILSHVMRGACVVIDRSNYHLFVEIAREYADRDIYDGYHRYYCGNGFAHFRRYVAAYAEERIDERYVGEEHRREQSYHNHISYAVQEVEGQAHPEQENQPQTDSDKNEQKKEENMENISKNFTRKKYKSIYSKNI